MDITSKSVLLELSCETTNRNKPIFKRVSAAFVVTAALLLGACSDSKNDSLTTEGVVTADVPETTELITTTSNSITEAPKPAVSTTSTTTIPLIESTTTTLSPEQKLLQHYTHLGEVVLSQNYQTGDRVGYMTENGQWLTDLYWSVDPFISEFTNYLNKGAGVAHNYEPGIAMNATIGGHNTTYTAPFSNIDETVAGDSLEVVYQKDNNGDGWPETVATLTYEAEWPTAIQIDPSETNYTVDQAFERPVLTRFTCSEGTKYRTVTRHILQNVDINSDQVS